MRSSSGLSRQPDGVRDPDIGAGRAVRPAVRRRPGSPALGPHAHRAGAARRRCCARSIRPTDATAGTACSATRSELRAGPDRARTCRERCTSARARGTRQQGDTDRAIAHAVQARDPVLAGDLLWADIVAYVTQGRNELVQRWLARFSRRGARPPIRRSRSRRRTASWPQATLARSTSLRGRGGCSDGTPAGRCHADLARRRPGGHRGDGRPGGSRRDGRRGQRAPASSSRETAPGARSTCFCTAPRLHLTGDRAAAEPRPGRGRRPQRRDRTECDVDVPGAGGDDRHRAAGLGRPRPTSPTVPQA